MRGIYKDTELPKPQESVIYKSRVNLMMKNTKIFLHTKNTGRIQQT